MRIPSRPLLRAMLLAVLLAAGPAAAPALAQQRDTADTDKAPWFAKDCLAPCANLAPKPCPDINDDVCFSRYLKEQRRQDACIHACEKAFWGSHDAGGYRQFKYR